MIIEVVVIQTRHRGIGSGVVKWTHARPRRNSFFTPPFMVQRERQEWRRLAWRFLDEEARQ